MWLLSLPAQGAVTEKRGVIRDVNLDQGWVTIDTRRFRFTIPLIVHNLAMGGDQPGALQIDRPVRFSVNRHNELAEIWVYPSDPAQRAKLGDDPEQSQP
jgi:hypothetical protein